MQERPLKMRADVFWLGAATMVTMFSYREIFWKDLPLFIVSNIIMTTGRQARAWALMCWPARFSAFFHVSKCNSRFGVNQFKWNLFFFFFFEMRASTINHGKTSTEWAKSWTVTLVLLKALQVVPRCWSIESFFFKGRWSSTRLVWLLLGLQI